MPRVIAPVLIFAAVLLGQTTGSVEGSVVDRVTGAGIPGASVTFYIRTQGVLAEATTDASGDFRIFGMKPGSYEVRFEKEGYIVGNRIPAQPYIVGQTSSPVQMRLEMTRLVSFSGRVMDPEGNPMSQGEVKLGSFKAPVAADGTFTIKDQVPGSYALTAIPSATRVPEGARVPVTTKFPESIVIRGDADISGYDARLETAEVYRVSGVVLDESGNPKPKVPVQLMPRLESGARIIAMGDFMTFVGPGPYVGPEEARVISGEDGSFEFPAVRSGDWQLAGVSVNGVLSIVVGNHSIENLRLVHAPWFNVSGTLDWGDVASGRRAAIRLAPTDGRTVAAAAPFVDANGTLNFSAVTPGQYLILPDAGPGFYPVSVSLGGQEVLGIPVDLLPGSTFRVTYKAATGSVHGTVDNCNGAAVVLVPKDIRTLAFGRTVVCKADGTFDMSGVAAGDYYAAALLGFQFDDARDPNWLAAIASIGTPVSVAQSSVSVQLKPNRSPE
jgi:hypothetical protein